MLLVILTAGTRLFALPAIDYAGLPEPLVKDLRHLENERGRKWDFQWGIRRTEELLGQYSEPRQQAAIMLTFLMTHGYSGIRAPDAAIDYAKRVESLPMAGYERARLYGLWADAVEWKARGSRGDDLAKVRREIAIIRLKCLRVAVNESVPREVSPVEPIRSNSGLNSYLFGPPPTDEQLRKREEARKASEQWQAWDALARFRKGNREVIASLYAKAPFNFPEIESLAEDILKDKEAIEDLMTVVRAHIKDRLARERLTKPSDLSEVVLPDASLPSE